MYTHTYPQKTWPQITLLRISPKYFITEQSIGSSPQPCPNATILAIATQQKIDIMTIEH